jgi:DNA-binding NtrC family response regulator
MMLRALRFRLAQSDDDPLEISSWSGTLGDLADGHVSGVYVVAEDTLAGLRGLDTLLNDRGSKHSARPLSVLLLGQPRVPLVKAAFTSARQLKRSLRRLLENARHRKERKAYVVGVPRKVLDEAAARAGTVEDNERPAAQLDSETAPLDPVEVPSELEKRLVGESREMHIVRQWIVRAAAHDEPVLILGETGTGKEVVARAIHNLNATRKHGNFEAVNCGAIPAELFESEVFGYVDGAFTGAHRGGSLGMWQHAAAGTIFLDEIGDLAPYHQVKLLRVLENRTIRPVGSPVEVKVDARVIAATNRELFAMVESGEFREDLYYRLSSMIITLPRLRDRPEDIGPLAAHFWAAIAAKRAPLSPEVLRELRQYRWHGNARELRYVLTNLHTAFPKSIPTVEHVRAVLRMRAPRETKDGGNGTEKEIQLIDYLRHLRRARAAIDACRRLARSIDRRTLDAERRMRLLTHASGCLSELQLLGTRPERFQNLTAFEATHRLAGGVAAFQSLLMRKDPNAVRYGRKDLSNEASAAWGAVKREEERVLKSL